MRTLSQSLFTATAIGLVVSAGAFSPSGAQQPGAAPGATRSYVQVVRLKPEMVDDWIAVQRNEVIPAQKKAGVTSRTTLVTVVGNTFEYVILTPFPTWAGFDGDSPLIRALGAAGAAAVNAKLRKSVQTQQSFMTNRLDSLSVPAGDAPVWRIAVRRAPPGKLQDYLAFHRAEVLPALQKAKAAGTIAGATVAVRGAGALTNEFTTVTYYAKFADLDAGDPLVAVLGRDGADRVNAKSASLVTSNQVIIRRRLADLSF